MSFPGPSLSIRSCKQSQGARSSPRVPSVRDPPRVQGRVSRFKSGQSGDPLSLRSPSGAMPSPRSSPRRPHIHGTRGHLGGMLKELWGAAPGDPASSLRGADDSGLRADCAAGLPAPDAGLLQPGCASRLVPLGTGNGAGFPHNRLVPGDHRTLLSAGTSEPVPFAGRRGFLLPCAHFVSGAHLARHPCRRWPKGADSERLRVWRAPILLARGKVGRRTRWPALPFASGTGSGLQLPFFSVRKVPAVQSQVR